MCLSLDYSEISDNVKKEFKYIKKANKAYEENKKIKFWIYYKIYKHYNKKNMSP